MIFERKVLSLTGLLQHLILHPELVHIIVIRGFSHLRQLLLLSHLGSEVFEVYLLPHHFLILLSLGLFLGLSRLYLLHCLPIQVRGVVPSMSIHFLRTQSCQRPW